MYVHETKQMEENRKFKSFKILGTPKAKIFAK